MQTDMYFAGLGTFKLREIPKIPANNNNTGETFQPWIPLGNIHNQQAI